MTRPKAHPRRQVELRGEKIVVIGKRGLTREVLAKQIHECARERGRLMRATVFGITDKPFDQLDDSERSILYAVADLFIERLMGIFSALEFYRDAPRGELVKDAGKAATAALAGKRP